MNLNETFIKKANEIHQNKYDYSLVNYKNNRTKVKIICSLHGEFEQTPDKHTNRKHGCPNCSPTKKLTVENFLLSVKKTHNDLFEYPDLNFKHTHDYIKIICKKHGKFEEKPCIHLQRNTCEGCKKDKVFERYIEECKDVHKNKYDYSLIKEYNSCYDKVDIICPVHGIFKQALHSHKQGFGCNICKSSKGEIKILDYLKNKNIKYISQHKIIIKKKKHIFDFYLPNYNTFIEFDGEQHFKSVERFGGLKTLLERINNDFQKEKYCIINDINLIRIPHWEINNIEKIIDSILK